MKNASVVLLIHITIWSTFELHSTLSPRHVYTLLKIGIHFELWYDPGSDCSWPRR